jgi:hypothetical protein
MTCCVVVSSHSFCVESGAVAEPRRLGQHEGERTEQRRTTAE